MNAVFPVVDVTGWTRINPEQMGTKPKFWCRSPDGRECLFKQSRSHAGEHWSEKLAAEIAGRLGLPHAAIELAVCDGKHGTISQNFLPPDAPASLVHGNELLFEHDPAYPIDAPNFRVAQHTLGRVFAALEQADVRLPVGFAAPEGVASAADLFAGDWMLDALTANTDRHHENWAVVVLPRGDGTPTMELAPTFDHASSLGRELTDDRREMKLAAERRRHDPRRPSRLTQTVAGYLLSDAGRSRIYAAEDDAKPLHPLQVFRLARERLPEAADAWTARLAAVPPHDFATLVARVPARVMSPAARAFCLCLLELNAAALTSGTFSYA